MAREHLAVCVHVDACALGLLQQVLQVVHVMAADQNGLALLGGDAHLGGCGVAVPVVQAYKQQLHLLVCAASSIVMKWRIQQRIPLCAPPTCLAGKDNSSSDGIRC